MHEICGVSETGPRYAREIIEYKFSNDLWCVVERDFFSASPRKPGGNKSFAFTAARRNEAFVCAKPIASSRGVSVAKFNQIKCFINHSALLSSPRSTFVSKEFVPTCFIDSVRSGSLTRSRDAALKSRFTRLWSPENWLRYSDAAVCVVKGPTSFSKLVSPSS